MKLVLCEGVDDKAVVEGLCLHAGIRGLTVEVYDGRSNLERIIGSLHIRSEFSRGEVESLAVLIDAEKDFDASFQKVQNAVRQGFSVEIGKSGVFVGDVPKVAGFVICGGGTSGMLEDLCLKSVNGEPSYKCMEEYFECLCKRTELKDYHPKAKFKAWM